MPRTNEENDTVSYSNSGKATNIEEHLSFTSTNTNTATATIANTAITIDIPTETAVNLTTAANVSTPAFVVDIASDSNDEGTNSSSKGRRKMPPVAEVFQLGIRQQQDVIRQKPPKQLRRSTEADIQRRRILDAMRTSTPITNNSQRTHASSSSVASRVASRQRQGATTTTNTSIANTTPALSSFSLSSLSSASASTSTSLLSAASGSHRPLSSLSMPRTVSQPVRRPHGRSPLAPPLSAQITPGMMTSYINAARGYPLSFPIHGAQHGTQDTSGYFGLLSSKTSPSLCKNESNRSKRQQSHRRQQAMEQNQEESSVLVDVSRSRLLHRSPSVPELPTYLSRRNMNINGNGDDEIVATQWEPQSARDFMPHYNLHADDDQMSELYPNPYKHGQHLWDDPRRPRLLHRHSSPRIRPRTYVNNVADEHTLVRKMDIRLIPFLSMLYLCSFLDRVNIGNARAAGIQEDLELSDEQFNWGSAIFFFGYVIFEVPSNVLLDLWRPSKIIALSMITWGIIMISMASIYNYSGLLSTRFFLGVAEAGLFPGVVFYLSMWYTRAEQTVRMALFFGAATLAGAFGGLIAYAILKLEGENGLNGWQWIFIIEGTATIFIACFALYFLPDFPEDENATFLTERERALAIARLAQDVTDAHSGRASTNTGDDHFFQVGQVIGAFKDWKVYMYALVHIFGSMPLYSFALNLPSILQGHGYDGVTSQLLSAPPYMFGCIVLLAVSHSSGVRGERGFHVAGAMLLGAIGFLILVFARNTSIQYTAAILACMGVFAQLPPVLSWFSNNLDGHLKRAAGTAIIISLGNLSGALGAHLYQDDDAPNYALGHTISAFSLLVGAIMSLSLKWLLHRENTHRSKLLPDERHELLNGVGSALLGDNHPDFRYIH